MKSLRKIKLAVNLAGLLCSSALYAFTETCPTTSCGPCGEVMTNLPMPSYNSSCGVQPFQNYLATASGYPVCGLNGFYLGVGGGIGSINYNLKVPGIIDLPQTTNSYITEFVNIGFAHASARFFIAGELAYYYNSVTRPIFYEDPSSFVFTSTGPPEAVTTVTPCSVRLDINANNHVALDLMPGFVATPRLSLYSRLGFEFSNYTWHRRICFPQTIVTTNAGVPVGVVAFDQDFGDNQSDAVVDFRLGAGATYAAGRHLHFNVSYVHIFGSKASFTPDPTNIVASAPLVIDAITLLPVPGVLVSNLNTLLAENTIDPSRNEILFGMTVSF